MYNDEVLNLIEQAIGKLEKERNSGKGSKQLSCSITKLEEAKLWRCDDLQEKSKAFIIEE